MGPPMSITALERTATVLKDEQGIAYFDYGLERGQVARHVQRFRN